MQRGDLGFYAEFRPEKSSSSPTPSRDGIEGVDEDDEADAVIPVAIIVPWCRFPDRTVHRGLWKPRRGDRGNLIIRWDNSYSKVRKKILTYDIKK